jgi:hypothetical protein
MDLRHKILSEHSRRQCDEIVAWVGDDQKRFDELFKLFLSHEYRIGQRSAWPVSYCVQENPSFISKHYQMLIRKMQESDQPDAVKRNGVRLLQYADIPEKYCGSVMDLCFQFVAAPDEAVAIKAFSLTVLGNLAKKYPDIVSEIKLLIEEQIGREKPAFKSRALKLLKEFEKS